MTSCSYRPGDRGFTLVELLIVLVLGSILALYAVPSLQQTIQKNRLDTASNQFVAMLYLARSEAVKQGTKITVTSMPTTNGVNWSQGWQLCCNPAGGPIQNGGTLANPVTNYGNSASVSFDSQGRLASPNTVPVNFIFCANGNPASSSGVTIALSGRVRIADTDKTTGLPLENDEATTMASCSAP